MSLAGVVHAQEAPAPKRDRVFRVGLHNESFTWSYGPEYHNSTFYFRIGSRVFSERINAYIEVSGNNPVLRHGFRRPRNHAESVHVCPNTYIAGFAGGLAATIYEADDAKWAVRGGLRYAQISQFEENQNWAYPADERTEIHVDGIVSITAGTWVERNFAKFGGYLGIECKDSEASGETLTFSGASSDPATARYSAFIQRDRIALRGIAGLRYDVTADWSLGGDAEFSGNGFGAGLGLSCKF